MGGHTLVEIHGWPFIGGHTWVGIHRWAGLSPSLFSCSKLPRVATIGVSVAGNNRGFPWVATRWCFRALRRGASVRCDKTSKPLGKAWRQPSISSATIPSFRHHHRLSPSSSFAIIVFRRHQVSPSLCFAIIIAFREIHLEP